MTKDISIIVIGIALFALIWVGWGQFEVWRSNTYGGLNEVVCTADAKRCADGSYVGRVAPDCAFASCPGE